MRPLTKCQPHLWRELDGTPSIIVIDTENGSYYRASEADAVIRHWQDEALCAEEAALSHAKRIAELEKRVAMLADQVVIRGRRMFELEAERDGARAELDRKRVLRNSDQTRARCKHFAICLAEIALNGNKEAEAAFRAVMPLVSASHPSRREVKEAARIASGGVFGVSDDPYQDAARGKE